MRYCVDDLITTDEVAHALRISKQTLWRYIEKGKLPPPRKISKIKLYWTKKQLEGFISGDEEKCLNTKISFPSANILDTQEASQFLQMSTASFYRLRKKYSQDEFKGTPLEFPKHKNLGRPFYLKDDLEKWCAAVGVKNIEIVERYFS